MRWKEEAKFKNSDVRVISKFLWLPKYIQGETRWLEKCKIKQIYFKFYCSAGGYWSNLKWEK